MSIVYNYNKVKYVQQHGFRGCRVYFLSFINDTFEVGRQVEVIITEFSEAFDTVDYGLLINELGSLGTSNTLLSGLTFLKGNTLFKCTVFALILSIHHLVFVHSLFSTIPPA